MDGLTIFFLNVGHGDCVYVELPNGARMMIDCGSGGDMSPYKLLTYYSLTRTSNKAISYDGYSSKYVLDKLVISHPHGDHLSDIIDVNDKLGFFLFVGGYGNIIDKIAIDQIDFRQRGKAAAQKFIDIVKERRNGKYTASLDRVAAGKPDFEVVTKHFLEYEDGIDLNDISRLTYVKYRGKKILFAGDLTTAGVSKILASQRAQEFRDFVKGTTILKVPHHGRENACSQEMFNAFGSPPALCVVSDEVLNEKNEGTSNTLWYTVRTSDEKLKINNNLVSRKVLTTRSDKDILLNISPAGEISVNTNCFANALAEIAKVK